MPTFAEKVVETLTANGSLPIVEIARNTGTSVGYARNQLSSMEIAGTIERVDQRVPIFYKINPNDPALKYKEDIKQAKRMLLAALDDKDNDLIKLLKKVPRNRLKNWADPLEVVAHAIRELDKEGKLVDTL